MNRWLWTVTVAGAVSAASGCASAGTMQADPAHAGGEAASGPASVTSLTSSNGDFLYTKVLTAPKALELHGINGNVHAVGAASTTAEVRAAKRITHGDPASQRVVVYEYDGGVVVCALVASQPDDDCRPGDDALYAGRHKGGNNDDLSFDFDVRVPSGVPFTVRTMNGNIDAKELQSELRVLTMNGEVAVQTTGHPLLAKTMNGRIFAPLTAAPTVPVQLESKNGPVELHVPAGSDFDLVASTMHGEIVSDFPISTSSSGPGPAQAQGKVGRGGTRVALKTMNGDIVVKRGP